MSARSRKSGTLRAADKGSGRAPAVEQAPSNSAQQQVMAGTESSLAIARDLALPQVQHALQVLQIPLRPAEQQQRMVDILQDSQLDAGRVAQLVAHLHESQAQGQAVRDAQSEGSPQTIESAMHQLHDDLVSGQPGRENWSRPDGVAVSVPGSSASDLMGALADSRGHSGSQILSFVQRVHLSVLLDEEEDLDLPDDYASQTSGG